MKPSYPGSMKIEQRVRPVPFIPLSLLPTKGLLRRARLVGIYTMLCLLGSIENGPIQAVAIATAATYGVVLFYDHRKNYSVPSYANTWPIDWRGVDVVGKIWDELMDQPRLSHQQAVRLANELLFLMSEIQVCEDWQLDELRRSPTSKLLRLAVAMELFARSGSWVSPALYDWRMRRGFSLLIYRYYAEKERPTVLYTILSKLRHIPWYRPKVQQNRRASNLLFGIDFSYT